MNDNQTIYGLNKNIEKLTKVIDRGIREVTAAINRDITLGMCHINGQEKDSEDCWHLAIGSEAELPVDGTPVLVKFQLIDSGLILNTIKIAKYIRYGDVWLDDSSYYAAGLSNKRVIYWHPLPYDITLEMYNISAMED